MHPASKRDTLTLALQGTSGVKRWFGGGLRPHLEASKIAMRTPPSRMEQHERELNDGEIAELSCTDKARRLTAQIAVVISNEVVSCSDEFGYIYRYDIDEPVEGAMHRVHAALVLWSRDGEMFEIAIVSKFQLPGRSRRPPD
jgi:hypothetical protein